MARIGGAAAPLAWGWREHERLLLCRVRVQLAWLGLLAFWIALVVVGGSILLIDGTVFVFGWSPFALALAVFALAIGRPGRGGPILACTIAAAVTALGAAGGLLAVMEVASYSSVFHDVDSTVGMTLFWGAVGGVFLAFVARFVRALPRLGQWQAARFVVNTTAVISASGAALAGACYVLMPYRPDDWLVGIGAMIGLTGAVIALVWSAGAALSLAVRAGTQSPIGKLS